MTEEQDLPATGYDAALLRRLVRYLRPYRWLATGAVLLLLLQSGLALVGPRLTEQALDVAIPGKDMGLLGLLAGLYVATLLLELTAEYGGLLLTTFVGQRVMYDLRMEIFAHLQRLSVTYFDRNPVGRLMTRVTSDVETLNELFSSGVVTIFGDVFTLLAIMAMMLVIDVKLALVTFAVIPLVWLTAAIFRRSVRDAFRDIRYRLARLNAYLQERLSGMRVVQLFGREEASAERFAELNREHLAAHLRSITIYAIFFPVVEVLTAVAMALLLWYGGLRVLDGTLTVGDAGGVHPVHPEILPAAAGPLGEVQPAAERDGLVRAGLRAAGRAGHRARAGEPQAAPPAAPGRGPLRGGLVPLLGRRALGAAGRLLRGLPGKTVALVGHTGAGKTTVVNLLLRFYDPDRGRITVDGVDIRELSTADLRSAIGFVQQDLFLFTGDILHNLTLGAPITADAARLAAERVGADRFIERLPSGYGHRLGERGRNLSVGERQLLSFARALALDPRILVLDEATSSVDAEAEAQIQRAIAELMAGPDQPGRGPPPQHHPACRRDPGDAPWGDPGARHAPGAAGGRRAVRAAVPAPTPGAGSAEDRVRPTILLACPRSTGYVWHSVQALGPQR